MQRPLSPTHEVELNFFYLHYNDALRLRDTAASEQSKLRSMFVRHSILAVIFAAESLVNLLLDDFSRLPSGGKYIQRLGIREKWFIAPMLCGSGSAGAQTFDASKAPFQQFSELVDLRNWLVHPKSGHFVEATVDGSTITIMRTGEEVPWVDTHPGGVWPQTQIPRNPFELTSDHAGKAIEVLDNMVRELKLLLPSIATDNWLKRIILRDKRTGEESRISTHSLWGGYTPGVPE